jgi:hypothetical protein
MRTKLTKKCILTCILLRKIPQEFQSQFRYSQTIPIFLSNHYIFFLVLKLADFHVLQLSIGYKIESNRRIFEIHLTFP